MLNSRILWFVRTGYGAKRSYEPVPGIYGDDGECEICNLLFGKIFIQLIVNMLAAFVRRKLCEHLCKFQHRTVFLTVIRCFSPRLQ